MTKTAIDGIRGLVFDMDGVIVDSHPAHRRAWRDFLCTLGKGVPDEDLDFILEGRKRQDILRHFLGEMSNDELHEYGKRKDEFFQKIADEVQPVPGVLDLLEELKRLGLRTAVATSASKRRTQFTLQKLEIARHFDVVVTGDDVPFGKPNPAVYQAAASRLNLAPNSLLALEDAPRGVEAAIAAGMRCIGLSSASRSRALLEAGAEHVFVDFVGVSIDKLAKALSSPMSPVSSMVRQRKATV